MTKLIDQIDGPADLKELEDDQLQEVAQEVRELIIDTIGEIGGHFGANLGACEIAVALHSLLDSPNDKILWDVGHQAYPHKVLTGRREQLHTIRKYGGLAPFCAMHEWSTTSWAPVMRRHRSRTPSGSRRPCVAAPAPTVVWSRSSATAR